MAEPSSLFVTVLGLVGGARGGALHINQAAGFEARDFADFGERFGERWPHLHHKNCLR